MTYQTYAVVGTVAYLDFVFWYYIIHPDLWELCIDDPNAERLSIRCANAE